VVGMRACSVGALLRVLSQSQDYEGLGRSRLRAKGTSVAMEVMLRSESESSFQADSLDNPVDICIQLNDGNVELHRVDKSWSGAEVARQTCTDWKQVSQIHLEARSPHEWSELGMIQVKISQMSLLELKVTSGSTLRMVTGRELVRLASSMVVRRAEKGKVEVHWSSEKERTRLKRLPDRPNDESPRLSEGEQGSAGLLTDDETCLIIQMTAGTIQDWVRMVRINRRFHRCGRKPAAHRLLSLAMQAGPQALAWAEANVPCIGTILMIHATDETCRFLASFSNLHSWKFRC
jgi:hypothetical protein